MQQSEKELLEKQEALKQEQAEKMERQQIKDAYLQGDEDGFHSTESQFDYEIEGRSDYVSEQYFNSVYGQS